MAKPIEYLHDARTDFDESFDWHAERSAVPQLDLLPRSTTHWTRYLTTPADFHQPTAAALIAPFNGIPFGLSSEMSQIDWSSLPSLMLNVDQDSGMVERSAGPNQ